MYEKLSKKENTIICILSILFTVLVIYTFLFK